MSNFKEVLQKILFFLVSFAADSMLVEAVRG
jgi:hypothetical protein